MDRQTLLAITLCFLIFMGWQKLYIEPRMPHPSVVQTLPSAEPPASSTVSPIATAAQPAPGLTQHPAQTVAVKSKTGEAIVGDGSQLLTAWNLSTYRLEIAPEAAAVDLHSVTNTAGEVEFAFDDPSLAYLAHIQGTIVSTPEGADWTYEDANVKLSRQIRSTSEQPYLNVQLNAEFKVAPPKFAFLSLASQGLEKDPEERDRQLLLWTNNSAERFQVSSSIDLKQFATNVKYIAASNRYFVLALINESPVEPKGLLQPLGPKSGRISMAYPVTGKSMSIPFRVYFGPKEVELLRNVEPNLVHAIDFGWFTIFAYPLLTLLKWLYQFVKNYGVAIILLTLLLKIVTYPLTYKSMKSMKEMAKIQPQLAKLREKYKDDKEALNREMLTLMKGHGYNPMAGCLPILIQMPIFFALYKVLYGSIELYHTPFMGWIKDLSYHDPFYVTPVLLSLTMFIQQKLSPNTATDPAQQKMMQFMPLIFGAFMLSLPAGLTLYMLTNAIASIVQQMILNKKLDVAHVSVIPARAK